MEKNEMEQIKPGSYLHHSFGYDMTINHFCKVLSNNGKTIKARMVKMNTTEGSAYAPGGATVQVTEQMYGPEFKIRIYKRVRNDINFQGEYFWLSGKFPWLYHKDTESWEYYTGATWMVVNPGRGYYENHLD